ncbi:CUB domain-containing protein 1-like isoform X1 [Betta splendens]|uniref:CUB domain-containing protein 1-like isoform X1 n=1 Tax=Betta splendens TaxID=158456 RepID=A0A6P7KNC8_BETSP|nr:CUB domain-containing protein 1-like isoform X1 [Betta splendens]
MARGPTWPRPLLHLERALPRLWHGSAYGKWVEGEIAASPCGASRKSETTLWRKRCLIPVGRRREHSMAVAGGEQLLLLAFFVSTVSGAQKLDVTPDAGTSLIIGGPRVRGCVVCTGPGPSPSPPCGSSLLLNGNTSVSLDFNCSRPQDVFQVEIVRSVECSTKSCNGHIVQSDSSFSLLLAFNRTFTWNLNASPQTAFRIDFPKPGLRQIRPWEACEDGHSFTLQASRATGSATIGKYCREGSISSVQIQSNGRFSVEVPARQKLQNDQFNVSVGEEIQSFAKITLTFPEGTSSSELLSPNYPDSVPSSSVIEWDIQVPDKHGTSVQFQNISQPRCLKNMAAVEYRSKGGEALVRSLTDAQRNEETGNVSVTLRNCEMDMKRSTSGLSVSLRVSITQVRCRVNMSEAEGLALRVDKVRPTSGCKIALNSEMKDEITVASSGELSFQDCSPEDVQVTATRVIECRQLRDCPRAPFPLVVPTLPRCLPAPLSSVTWTFRLPQHATLELASPRGPLKQALPGQPCTDSLLVTLTEDSRGPIGDFCPQGAVERLQIHTNVSVTVSNVQKQAVKTCYKHALNVRFKEEIPERYIFTVAAKTDSPVLLATPGWPAGMEGYSTVSWFVSVPADMEARLVFANLTQPKCRRYHTDISVRRVGRPMPEYSRRGDEPAPRELTVPGSFYLNMSNCQVDKGRFSVLTQVSLQAPKAPLAAVLGAAAAVVALVVVAVVVACVVMKKRKSQSHQSAVYDSGAAQGFPKRRADNGSHEYATIDEMLIYSHLLTGEDFETGSEKASDAVDSGGPPVDVYRAFQAPPLPDRPPSRSLVDNDLYQTGTD